MSWYPHEIETLNLETGDIADYRTTAQGMELEVLDAEEKRLAVLYFRWDEVAPLLRGMYARQMDGFGQEQPQPSAESPTFHSETVAVYPGDKNNLPYDVVVERLHIEEPEPPAPVTEPEKTFEEVLDEHPVSIQVNGQWETFSNAKAAEEASYEEYKATLLLKGQMTHRATLGTDPRGNLTRIDNALAQMPQRLEAAKAQLDNLYQQQDAAKEEVGKPFLYEEELRSKNARLVELDTLLNIDGKGQAHAETVVAKSTRTSVLDSLKRPATPRSTDKKPKQHEEVR